VAGFEGDYNSPGAGFTLRWNGSTWTRYDVPGSRGTDTMSILPLSSTNAWAYIGGSGSIQYLWHWDGTGWTRVTEVPRHGFLPWAYFGSLASDGEGGVWIPALGETSGSRAGYLHWDGSQWTTVYGPQRDNWTDIMDLAPIPGSRSLWSVGYKGTGLAPVIERFDPE
jgi:hypothetical protein